MLGKACLPDRLSGRDVPAAHSNFVMLVSFTMAIQFSRPPGGLNTLPTTLGPTSTDWKRQALLKPMPSTVPSSCFMPGTGRRYQVPGEQSRSKIATCLERGGHRPKVGDRWSSQLGRNFARARVGKCCARVVEPPGRSGGTGVILRGEVSEPARQPDLVKVPQPFVSKPLSVEAIETSTAPAASSFAIIPLSPPPNALRRAQ